MAIRGGYNVSTERQRKGVAREFNQHFNKDADVDTFVDAYSAIDKVGNWDRCMLSSALGAAALDNAIPGVCFDGRYVYYTIRESDTFIRFDTTLQFSAAASWEQISGSTIMGEATTSFMIANPIFDGRYVYYIPTGADTTVRFDTTLAFTATASWEICGVSTMTGAAGGVSDFAGGTFDGRYVYYIPNYSNTLCRYDTTLSFTATASWGKVSMSTVTGSTDNSTTHGTTFDGRYVYVVPKTGQTAARFDTVDGTFTSAASWEKISFSSVAGGSMPTNSHLGNACSDGRYVYFAPYACATMLRYDNTLPFTETTSFELMMKSTAMGVSPTATDFMGCAFDGRYVYYCPYSSDTFLRFDTTGEWTDTAMWSNISMSTAQGAAALNGWGRDCCYDGKYVYFGGANTDTLLRVIANPK